MSKKRKFWYQCPDCMFVLVAYQDRSVCCMNGNCGRLEPIYLILCEGIPVEQGIPVVRIEEDVEDDLGDTF